MGGWTGLIWLRIGHVAESCERDQEHSGFYSMRGFIEQLSFSITNLLHALS